MRVTEENFGSASSHIPAEWSAIDWRKVQKNVRVMQHRLAKATSDSDWRRVKALQRWLTHSFCAKAAAIKRVTENQGKRTSGVDRQLWETPQLKHAAIANLGKSRYRPLPLRRVNIPKTNGTLRPLGIPTMKDRAMQALHLLALDPVLETVSDQNSYGFRKNRATADAMSQIFVRLSRKGSAEWVLDADIEGFFDNISHQWMIDNVRMDKSILTKWLKSGVVDGKQLLATTAGTPQGGIISPALANWTLNGLEAELVAHLDAKWGVAKAKKLKVGVIRYADDFVITGASRELLEDEIKPWVENFLAIRGLRLAKAKTKIVHVDEGFDFLGWNFRKYTGKLLIKPSKKNVKAFYKKLGTAISDNLGATQENLIRLLNPMLRGWAQYHSPVVAKQTFSRLESLLFWRLMRWAKRRHPTKSADWIRKKYWRTVGNRHWVFACQIDTEFGNKATMELYSLAGTAIERHIKIKGAFNPYDPSWEMYGETLRMERMVKNMRYRKEWIRLYVDQDGKCALCGYAMDFDTGWHDHHMQYRVAGGSDALGNRVLLHPNCHSQVHSLGLKVTKPVPV
ncbi:group II intron-encoded protein LtrA [Janthinobacterium sp. HH103]|jgi:RNA-directed DNA polymerase|uniref:group II intron reverse transcriptase/maturase n=1 Tax=unclassified Janthinobacterium TaxID=2610881 RepID=UPI0008758D5F|nr:MULTISPECIES: group II intron reverse transcriptase/maturase [unclassified Janthinobacterium]OEZ53681.1 group II intron-encoded protein LtrA [Janthinobacterium sp. HH100]OEZ78746.1 group II intron-encoded protein LtrA [Janthinobacterium sp. HH103]QOU76039.1 Reverse transcriptase (RNA-dependent DNA polymerase) [Janthinobacterium sp. HH102]